MIYKYLPYFIFKKLFGDRKKFGSLIDFKDPDFIKWKSGFVPFYQRGCHQGIGRIINHTGYKILKDIEFKDKVVLEVGPGIIDHLACLKDKPGINQYILADINEEFLSISEQRLKESGICNVVKLIVDGRTIPVKDASVDIIITFNQLEHVYELDKYLKELFRVLKPGGLIAGSVPVEGGIAWGLGRFLTSRRYVFKVLKLDYDKIICWEHQNFIDKLISSLNYQFVNVKSVKKPVQFFPFDLNLSWSFIYRKN